MRLSSRASSAQASFRARPLSRPATPPRLGKTPRLGDGRRFLRGGERLEEVDLRAGDEVVLLAGDQHQRLHLVRPLRAIEEVLELLRRFRREGVDRVAGCIEGEDGDVAVEFVAEESVGPIELLCRGGHHARSRTTAAPRPPAAQTVHITVFFPLRLSSLSAWVTTRAPVAPNG